MKYFILPYKIASSSAKLLASALNCKRIKGIGSHFIHTQDSLIINWGRSYPHPKCSSLHMLNTYDAVERATNKVLTLLTLQRAGVPHVEFTTDQTVAQALVDAGNVTYGRHLVSSSCGRGIVIYTTGPVMAAPLYTKSFPTHKEYRVYVFKGSVIDITQKKRRSGAQVNNQIRNHDNGWVFCHNDIEPIGDTNEQIAINGVQTLGLDFGAVDLLINSAGHGVICEINSAPGLEPNGTTFNRYKQAFQSYLESLA